MPNPCDSGYDLVYINSSQPKNAKNGHHLSTPKQCFWFISPQAQEPTICELFMSVREIGVTDGLGAKRPRLSSRHDMFETRQNILECQLNAI